MENGIPKGWSIRRVGGRITVQHPDFGGYCADLNAVDKSQIAPVILYHLAEAILTTPTPATTPETEWVKLPHDVVINGGMTFRKGVKLSTFIKAAERWHREAMKQYAGISKEDMQEILPRPPHHRSSEQ